MKSWRTNLAILLVAVFLSSLLFGQTAMAAATFSVSGKVTLAGTTTPIAGVTVTIGGRTATTSSTGTYTVTLVPAGTQTLRFAKSGYSVVTKTVTVASNLSGQNAALYKQYTVTATAGTGGTISPAGATKVNAGGTLTFTITPSTNYVINTITITTAATASGAQSSTVVPQSAVSVDKYTMTNVQADKTISVTFKSTLPADPFKNLSGGTTVNIAAFNSKKMYAIVAAQPASKPQGYGSPTTLYDYTLDTTAATSSVAGGRKFVSDAHNDRLYAGVYPKAQVEWDDVARKMELKMWASGGRQYNRLTHGITASAPTSISVGTTWNNVYIATSGNTINTTCKYISSSAYFFVDNRDIAAMQSYLAGYGTSFDAIYTKNRTKFGNENDTDHNGKVIIIFSRELSGGLLGYFYSVDKYPKTTYSESNEGDIFYITTTAGYQGTTVKGTLAHEFQHMIFFDQHYNRGVVDSSGSSVWLNEALSQVAEYYNGYLSNHHAWIANYLNNGWIGLSLTHWTSSNYGYGALFGRYLRDQYGDTAIKKMCSTGNLGVQAVEAATGKDFNLIFDNFTKALVMDDTGDTISSQYKFTTLNLATIQPYGRKGLTTSTALTAGYDVSGSLYPYRLFFSSWTGKFGTMKLSGTGIKGAAFGLKQ